MICSSFTRLHVCVWFSFILSLNLQAQDWSGKIYKIGKIYPGYYVSNNSDTINGYFKHGNQKDSQQKCYFYKQETDPKPSTVFGVQDISGYKVADKLYRSIHFSGGLFEKPLRFNLVVNDGGITEFIFYAEDGSTDNFDVYYKAQDPANPKPVTLQYFAMGFSKKMSEYVADYPELSKKVAEKADGYGMLKILDIIKEYNQWFASKN